MKKLKEILEKIKAFVGKVVAFAKKAWKFLKKWGLQLVNLLVLLVAYGSVESGTFADFLVGFWCFVLLAYYIFWKLCRAETLFEKKDEDTGLPL